MNPQKRGKLEEQLSAYLDGELSADQRAEVEAFLAGDEQARRLLEDLRRTANLLQALPRAKAGEELIDALRGRLERKALLGEPAAPPAVTRRRPIRSYAARWAAVAAVLALSLTALYLIWPPEPNGGQRQPGQQQIAMRDEPAAVPVPSGAADTRLIAPEAVEAPARERIAKVTEDTQPLASVMQAEEADSSVMLSVDGDSTRPIEDKITQQLAAPETMLAEPTRREGLVIELAYADRPSLDRAVDELSTKYGFRSGDAEVHRFDTGKTRSTKRLEISLDDRGQVPETPVVVLSVDLPDHKTLNEIIDGIRHTRNRVGGPRDMRIKEYAVLGDEDLAWSESRASLALGPIKKTEWGGPRAKEKSEKSVVVDEQKMRRGISAFLSRLKNSLADYGFVETLAETDGVVTDTHPVSQPTGPPLLARESLATLSRSASANNADEFSDRIAGRPHGPVANQPVELAESTLTATAAPATAAADFAFATEPAEPVHVLRLYLRVPEPQTRPEKTP